MKKIILFLLCISFVSLSSSCSHRKESNNKYMQSAANIQNGGYVVKHEDCYFYTDKDDNTSLYKCDIYANKKKITGGHYFYEMNVYNNEIYYISSSPGEVWKVSTDGAFKKKIINHKVGNLLVYNDKIYYRLSEDDDWGKLYCADLNGRKKKLLADKVKNFCIYNDIIYYLNINNGNSSLCSMNTDGTNNTIITYVYTNNVFIENDMLIYSDHNRKDKLYIYDMKNNMEKCISEDKCWDINGNKDWIFYRNQNDAGSLYCVSYDGEIKKKLSNQSISDILIIEDIIFYRNLDKNNIVEYYNMTHENTGDGSVVLTKKLRKSKISIPSGQGDGSVVQN